ncbi:MAG: YceH family protein [Planctomycetota bacterium]|nr:YceH family protein [Planctomycetota bacterium]
METSLNGHEARVLGVLIEKAFTTPDQYPLSLNGATNGCNQKSNRDPVLDFSEAEVRVALQGLRMKGLVGVSVPSGSRVEKYRHNAKETLKLGERALAVLSELLLRGPQTAGELRTRAKRMRDVTAPDALEEALGALEEHGFARPLAGGRATRWAQSICPELHPDGEQTAPDGAAPAAAAAPASAPDRVAELERRVEALERTVQRLAADLGLDEEAAR